MYFKKEWHPLMDFNDYFGLDKREILNDMSVVSGEPAGLRQSY
jgi:hypothetical protein